MSVGLYIAGEFIAPWRNISRIGANGDITYYTPQRGNGCVPCVPTATSALSRHSTRIDQFHEQHPDAPTNDILAGKSVLLIVNPKSGTGSASKVKSNIGDVTTILSEAGLQTDVRYTEGPRHAVEIVKEYGLKGLSRFVAVASVGGDGTLHEVINGFAEAVEAEETEPQAWNKIPPLAIVPGGTGNAIALSMGISSAKHAALNIIHALRSNRALPATLMSFASPPDSESKQLLIGGIQWGLPADVDQGTENLRWMGDTRFSLGAILHIVQRKSCHARIRVTVDPAKNATVQEAISSGAIKRDISCQSKPAEWGEEVEGDTYILDDDFVMVVAWNSSMIADGLMVTPHAKVTELGVFDFIACRSHLSRGERLQVLLNAEDGSFMHKSNKHVYLKARSVTFEDIEGEYLTADGESVPVKSFRIEADSGDRLRILDSFSAP